MIELKNWFYFIYYVFIKCVAVIGEFAMYHFLIIKILQSLESLTFAI